MSECYYDQRCFCWNGCDDALKEGIKRNNFVKEVRSKLAKKKMQNRYKKNFSS